MVDIARALVSELADESGAEMLFWKAKEASERLAL